MKHRLLWKIGAALMAILAIAIAFAGYGTNAICEHYSLDAARTFLRFNSESIIRGIGELMMSRNNRAIKKLLVDTSQGSDVYGEIRLISHHSGKVVASRLGEEGTVLTMGQWECATCHDRGDLGASEIQTLDLIRKDDPHIKEGRVLTVLAPVENLPSCKTAACHVHTNSPPILGFLQSDYSLEPIDETVSQRQVLIFCTAFLSLILSAVALRLMLIGLLEQPIRRLIAGTRRIADGDLDHRFPAQRNDELGTLEKSFNFMTETIQHHEQELRGAKEYLESIVENSADLIITVTPEGIIHTFNRGAELALGFGRHEVIGRPITMLFRNPEERNRAIERLHQTGQTQTLETQFVTKDGGIRHVLLTLTRLCNEQGEFIGTLGVSKDITREKELQARLIHSQKLAAIGQAVTGIQHTIKNLLNALTGGIYLIRNGLNKDNRERIEEGCEMVEDGVEKISELARNMLQFARNQKLEPRETDLNELVTRVCQWNQTHAEEHNVSITVQLDEEMPPVYCDPKLVETALADIVVNAIEACQWKDYPPDERPTIVLRTRRNATSGAGVIEIEDNGCGMESDVKEHIFTPFFTTKESRGTGLGLALAARIIEAHEGFISVESVSDKGSTFRIQLPLHRVEKRGS